MKKILFSLILLSSFVFGAVKDEGKVFKVEEVKALNDRINLLKEQTATDFEVVTLAEENEKVFSGLENATRKVIVVLQKGEENSIKVKLAFSNDINLTGYEDKINKKLEELERVISPKTFSDYTLELLAETGDVLTSIQLDEKSHILSKNENGDELRYTLYPNGLIKDTYFLGKKISEHFYDEDDNLTRSEFYSSESVMSKNEIS